MCLFVLSLLCHGVCWCPLGRARMKTLNFELWCWAQEVRAEGRERWARPRNMSWPHLFIPPVGAIGRDGHLKPSKLLEVDRRSLSRKATYTGPSTLGGELRQSLITTRSTPLHQERNLLMADSGRYVVPKDVDPTIVTCKCPRTEPERCTTGFRPKCTCMRRGRACNSKCPCGNDCDNRSSWLYLCCDRPQVATQSLIWCVHDCAYRWQIDVFNPPFFVYRWVQLCTYLHFSAFLPIIILFALWTLHYNYFVQVSVCYLASCWSRYCN